MLLTATSIAIAEFKADASKRQVTGYASVFGNVDHNGDVVMPGAFTKTLKHEMPGGRIKVKRNHTHLIGKPIHAEQDTKGLLTVSQISKTALGDETLALIEDGVIDRMSIGFYTEKKSMTKVDGRTVRQLEQARLGEWSFLDEDPANDDATVISVKSLDDVCSVIDQMSYAANHLRALTYIPPDIADRLRELLAELGPIVSPYPPPSENAAAMRALLAEMQSYVQPAA